MYGLQHGALAHTEQQAIKGPKITSAKTTFLEVIMLLLFILILVKGFPNLIG